MKVKSPLANMDIGIAEVHRSGNNLILKSGPGSSIDTEISVSASEVLRTIGKILATPSGLGFVLGLPYFWLRQKLRRSDSAAGAPRPVDINKPW